MYFIFGLCGALSGLIMAGADILLDLKGPDNRELGSMGLIKTAWEHMDEKRFRASIVLAMVGCPMQALGITAMARQLSLTSPGWGLAFWLIGLVGISGSFFIHTLLCLFPILSKFMSPRYSLEEQDALILKIYDAVKLPFWIQYLCLVGLSGFMIMGAIFLKLLPLSPWLSLVTAPVLTILGLLLRKWKPKLFYDLPGIVMPSLGVGAIGLLATLSM